MKLRPTLSIGIPAFNEEANIRFLLQDLLAQKRAGFILDKIVVYSDGSSDETVKEIKNVKNSKIILIESKKRSGRAVGQNKIMKDATSDILVLVDADVVIKDKNFLEKIIKPIAYKKADLTSVSVEELKPETFLGKVLEVSMKFKKYIFENYKNGNNLYTCHGRARAFSKKLYKSINFIESVGEDAYSYFYVVSNNFKYRFVKNTQVYYHLPEDFKDHEKQSIRFYKTLRLLEKDFGKALLQKENYITLGLLIKALIKYLFVNPLIAFYFLIATFLKIKSLFTKEISGAWSVSESSKKIRSNT